MSLFPADNTDNGFFDVDLLDRDLSGGKTLSTFQTLISSETKTNIFL